MGIFQGKPKKYWEEKWNSATGNDYDKAITLLVAYSGAYKAPIGPGYWFSSTGRFFKGHWNTHHGDAVTQTLDLHKTLDSTVYAASDEKRDIYNLFADLKSKLGNQPLKPEGDLARIIKVIEEKTQIQYADISTEDYGEGALAAAIRAKNL